MKINLPSRLAPIAVAALLIAPAAIAQTTPSPQSSPPPAAMPQGAPATPQTPATAAQRVNQRIEELHAELHITPAQQQQWNSFAEVMRANARDMDTALKQREQEFPHMTAVQNLQSYETLARKHADHLQKLASAFAGLYSGLSGDQKKLADDEFRAKAEARADQREMQSGSSAQPHGMQPPH